MGYQQLQCLQGMDTHPPVVTQRLDLLETGAAGKHGEPPKHQLLEWAQQAVTPIDGIGDGSLPLGKVDRS